MAEKRENEKLRRLPSVDRVLGMLEEGKENGLARNLAADTVRSVLKDLRERLKKGDGEGVSILEIVRMVKKQLNTLQSAGLQKVINGTGVVLHTNLGRAPLGQRAVERLQQVAFGYCNLEYDIDSGERGSRYQYVAEKICRLTGAEDALVVNNNAAAVLLVLAGLAQGRQVLVSRGELVEIGGSFRIPDVLKQSGAQLIEVGATNKTHLQDYEAAINSETGLLLKVHTSNYRIIGFASQPELKDVVALAHRHHLPVAEDLGSGSFLPLSGAKGWREPTVRERLASGVDIVTFSGDKLLGACQAGIIAGKKMYLDQLKKHPLMRALRIDKLSLAVLEGALLDYLWGNPLETVPVQRMLHRSQEALSEQAKQLADGLSACLGDWNIGVEPVMSMAGGGTLPEEPFPSWCVAIQPPGVSTVRLEQYLRTYSTPIIARLQEQKLLVDVRCLSEEDIQVICHACRDFSEEENSKRGEG